jgi:hypothetical protein
MNGIVSKNRREEKHGFGIFVFVLMDLKEYINTSRFQVKLQSTSQSQIYLFNYTNPIQMNKSTAAANQPASILISLDEYLQLLDGQANNQTTGQSKKRWQSSRWQ